jgi:hypothetical protein
VNNRRGLAAAIFAPLLIGFIGLANLTRQPRFQSYHNVDILQLLASGMCFGVALAAIIAYFRGPRTASEK